MNVENILKVANAIEKHEVKWLGFNMGDFLTRNKSLADRSGHNCGTTACIAGWTAVVQAVEKGRIERNTKTFAGVYATDPDEAEYLGIDGQQAHCLFFDGPAGVSFIRVTSQMAVATLCHLANTGKVDWNTACEGLLP